MSDIAKKTQITQEQVSGLINSSLKRMKPETLKSYSYGLSSFAKYLDCKDPQEALMRLLQMSRGEANYTVLQFMNHLVDQGHAPSTVNARHAAIKGRVKDAKMIGLVTWEIDVKPPRRKQVKDVSGPTEKEFQRILRYVSNPRTNSEKRLKAIVFMMAFMALRRNEIASLDIEHIDFPRERIKVLRKGQYEREWKSMPPSTAEALRDWIRAAGIEDGPLFINFNPAKLGDSRLSVTSIYRIIRKMGDDCGIDNLHPHAFRHFSITEALEVTDGNTRKTQKHSGHTDARQIDTYEDAREDQALQVASLIEKKWIG